MGHDLAEFGPVGMALFGLVPMGYAGHAFNIDTDIDFHFS
jgi:hypothetical protein